jgi:hypothetical protein
MKSQIKNALIRIITQRKLVFGAFVLITISNINNCESNSKNKTRETTKMAMALVNEKTLTNEIETLPSEPTGAIYSVLGKIHNNGIPVKNASLNTEIPKQFTQKTSQSIQAGTKSDALIKKEATSDENGNFELKLKSGSYLVSVNSFDGNTLGQITLEIASDGKRKVNVTGNTSLSLTLNNSEQMKILSYLWNVPYNSQKEYSVGGSKVNAIPLPIGASACAPTSFTMLLNFYYPNSYMNLPEVYQAGLQAYTFEGKATDYKNVSFATNPDDSVLSYAHKNSVVGYSGNYSGASSPNIKNYSNQFWKLNLTELNEDDVYEAIKRGPLLGSVYAHGFGIEGCSGEKCWPHFIVIVGIDTKGTIERDDDTVIIHDPFDNWYPSVEIDSGGQNKGLSYNQFFVGGRGITAGGNKWFRRAWGISPKLEFKTRVYSALVDSGHNTSNGYSFNHKFELDDVSNWKYWYGNGGDWFYPNADGAKARWTPQLSVPGHYKVSTIFRADNTVKKDQKIQFAVHDPSAKELIKYEVDPYSSKSPEQGGEWREIVLTESIYLKQGSYVRATGIPKNANIDAVRFEFIRKATFIECFKMLSFACFTNSNSSNPSNGNQPINEPSTYNSTPSPCDTDSAEKEFKITKLLGNFDKGGHVTACWTKNLLPAQARLEAYIQKKNVCKHREDCPDKFYQSSILITSNGQNSFTFDLSKSISPGHWNYCLKPNNEELVCSEFKITGNEGDTTEPVPQTDEPTGTIDPSITAQPDCSVTVSDNLTIQKNAFLIGTADREGWETFSIKTVTDGVKACYFLAKQDGVSAMQQNGTLYLKLNGKELPSRTYLQGQTLPFYLNYDEFQVGLNTIEIRLYTNSDAYTGWHTLQGVIEISKK